jgi:hypothetical protein
VEVEKPEAAEIAPDWLKPYCKQLLSNLADQGCTSATLRTHERMAAAWPLNASAQWAGKVPSIGFLGQSTRSAGSEWVAACCSRSLTR